MNEFKGKNRRQHDRYITDVQVKFHVNFDLNTKIDYQLHTDIKSDKTYSAIGRNVNVEGLCFVSDQELAKGSTLLMQVFLPSVKEPIPMEGKVRWSHPDQDHPGKFETGVKILSVRGEEVEKTIAVDPVHKIRWSIVLEAVFGGFKDKILKDKKLS